MIFDPYSLRQQFFTIILWQIWPIFSPLPLRNADVLNERSPAVGATGTLEILGIHESLVALESAAWIFEITGPLIQEDKKQSRMQKKMHVVL
mgnify:FL=1